MKKKNIGSFVLALVLCLSLCCMAAGEETLTEYRDDLYSFSYPSSWTQGVARDGSIILELPGGQSAVMTFAIKSDMIRYTGDPEIDNPLVEISVAEYSEEKARADGKNTALDGSYELIEVNGMHGFRAAGKWLATGWDLALVILTDGKTMVSFELVGAEALESEQRLLETVKTFEQEEAESNAEGFLRCDGIQFALDYPESYSMMDYGLKDGCAVMLFADPADPNNLFMARTYLLDTDYTEDMAPAIAAAYLPKSTGVNAAPETVQIGGREMAVIRGNMDAGPLAFYVTGSGSMAMAVLFTGEGAVGLAEQIMASVEIK